jgi:hypothetical protein
MNKLISAIQAKPQYGRTENNAKTLVSTTDHVLDFFYLMGASRGKDITPQFSRAYTESPELTARALMYLRDAREGIGERELFRTLFKELARENPRLAIAVLVKLPELGRWDDVVEALNVEGASQGTAIYMIEKALKEGNGLAAKWMPRKGELAARIRTLLGMTPKQYRKTIVGLSNTVEQKLCAREFTKINYSHVPGIAAARYQATFARHDPEGFAKYKAALVKGDDPKVKVNAGAIFPYDVIKGLQHGDETVANAQWNALPDFTGGSEQNAICVVDVSGSMTNMIPNSNVSALDVAVSLGLYLSERLNGPFKDTFLTFSEAPELQKVGGTLKNRMQAMMRSKWGMNTNLQAVFQLILGTAIKNKLAQEDLPSKVLIISDMEFDQCTNVRGYTTGYGKPKEPTNFQAIKQLYKDAGYEMPQLVFWNVMARNTANAPAKATQKDVALVSGFSPAVVKSVLSNKSFTPRDIMLETLMRPRYDL